MPEIKRHQKIKRQLTAKKIDTFSKCIVDFVTWRLHYNSIYMYTMATFRSKTQNVAKHISEIVKQTEFSPLQFRNC